MHGRHVLRVMYSQWPRHCNMLCTWPLSRCLSQDAALAALAVALYAADGLEERLLGYLQTARDAIGRPLYDPHTALRVCRSHDRLRVRPRRHHACQTDVRSCCRILHLARRHMSLTPLSAPAPATKPLWPLMC
jgi:hypothetical protein